MALALSTASLWFSSWMLGCATGRLQRNLASLSMSPLSSRVSHTVATWLTVNDNVGNAKIGAGTIGPLAEGAVAPVPAAGATADISSVSILQDPSRSRIHLCSVSAPTGSTSKHRCHRPPPLLLLSIGLKKLSDSICVCSSRFSSCLPSSVSNDSHYFPRSLSSRSLHQYVRHHFTPNTTLNTDIYIHIYIVSNIGSEHRIPSSEFTRTNFRRPREKWNEPVSRRWISPRSSIARIVPPLKVRSILSQPRGDWFSGENVTALSIIPKSSDKTSERGWLSQREWPVGCCSPPRLSPTESHPRAGIRQVGPDAEFSS